jgi:hypothetical protein
MDKGVSDMSNTGVKVHDDAVLRAENTRQTAVAAASTQAAVITAEISCHRAIVKSALANGVSTSASMSALRELGQTGL